MKIELLRKLAGKEEIDYQFIISALKDYSSPRDKITNWLKSGDLIRIKKGLYVFGKKIALEPYSKEVLANIIYGPSAISLIYALSYYGLIPEKVNTVTSICTSRNKKFLTALGKFTYYYLNPSKFNVGVVIDSLSKHQSFLIATPEKALCDQIHLIDKDYKLLTPDDLESYLFHNLRIDELSLLKFNLKTLKEISAIYRDKQLQLLFTYIKNRK